MWESGLIESRHTNLSNITLDVIYTIVLLLSIIGSLYASLGNYRIMMVVIFVNVALIAIIVATFAHLKTEFRRTYEDAKSFQGDIKIREINGVRLD